MMNLFSKEGIDLATSRINKLNPETKGQWGKMSVDQMLAHVNVSYEMAYTDKHSKPGAVGKFFLKLFVKNAVVGPKPYKKNGQTAPAFKITEKRDFEIEKKRLIDYLNKTEQLGADYYHNKESHSFGHLSKTEWNTLFAKHLEHHLTQFGV